MFHQKAPAVHRDSLQLILAVYLGSLKHVIPTDTTGTVLSQPLTPAIPLPQASSLPMSIIIVGVGPAMFEGE